MSSITAQAHAKINLTLDVGARRTDGYHAVRSVMQTVGLHDTLTLTQTPEEPGVWLEVVGDEAAGVPADESNLVHRAATRLQKVAAARGILPGDESGLHVRLEKRIPTQAGLGGGSSDAAATLRAVNTLFRLELSLERLTAMAAELGADVAFFLVGGTALAEGLGERVTPLPPCSAHWPLVIVKPPVGVSTARAYGALDALPGRATGGVTEVWLAGRCDALGNDFERMVLAEFPAVAEAHRVLTRAAGAEGAAMPLLCGSGAALFVRVRDSEAAERLAERARAAGIGQVWVTETVGGGH